MEYRRLGDSELNVSSVCMGTMVFGEQVEEPLAHQLLDDALARGVNFFDTAVSRIATFFLSIRSNRI